jgi:hypothetical protein
MLAIKAVVSAIQTLRMAKVTWGKAVARNMESSIEFHRPDTFRELP